MLNVGIGGFVRTKLHNRTVLKLMGAAGIAQIVNVLVTPILSRLYTPSDYGVLGIIVISVSYTSTISTLSCNTIMASQPDEKSVDHLLRGSIIISTLVCVIATLSLLVAKPMLSNSGIVQVICNNIVIVFLMSLSSSYYILFSSWATRRRLFNDIALTRLTQSIVGSAVSIVLGLLHIAPLGLFIGTLIKGSWGIIRYTKRYLEINTIKDARLQQSCFHLYAHKKLMFFGTLQLLVNTSAFQIPILFMSHIFTKEDVGQFVMSMQILSLPLIVLGTAFSQDLLGNMSSIYHIDKIKAAQLWINTAKKLLWAVLLVIILSLVMPTLLPAVLGKKWVLAGSMAKCIGIYTSVQIFVSPLSSVVYVMKKQKIQLMYDASRLIIIAACFYIGVKLHFTSLNTVILYSLGMCISYCFAFAYYYRLVHVIYSDRRDANTSMR